MIFIARVGKRGGFILNGGTQGGHSSTKKRIQIDQK